MDQPDALRRSRRRAAAWLLAALALPACPASTPAPVPASPVPIAAASPPAAIPPASAAAPVEPGGMPPFDPAAAASPVTASGSPPAAPPGSPAPDGGPRFVQLVVRASSDGKAQLLSATEVPGEPLLLPAGPSGWMVEVFAPGRSFALSGLPDPYERRSTGVPHQTSRGNEAVLTISVPGVRLPDLDVDGLSISLLRLRAGPTSAGIDLDTLAALKAGNKVEVLALVSTPPWRDAVRTQGTVVNVR